MLRTIIHAIANTLLFLCLVSVTCDLLNVKLPLFAWMYLANEGEKFPPGTFAHSIRTIVISLYFTYRILTLDKSKENKTK